MIEDTLATASGTDLLQMHQPLDDLLLIFRRYLRERFRHGALQPISFRVIKNLQQILLRALRLARDSDKRREYRRSLSLFAVAGCAILGVSLRRLQGFTATGKRGGRGPDDLRLHRRKEKDAPLLFPPPSIF